jgi:hypothetical protein
MIVTPPGELPLLVFITALSLLLVSWPKIDFADLCDVGAVHAGCTS